MAGITSNSWQVAAASVVLPLNALAGSPAFLSSVAFLGASALLVGVATTCWYGFSVTSDFWGNVAALPWFTSPQGLSLPPPLSLTLHRAQRYRSNGRQREHTHEHGRRCRPCATYLGREAVSVHLFRFGAEGKTGAASCRPCMNARKARQTLYASLRSRCRR